MLDKDKVQSILDRLVKIQNLYEEIDANSNLLLFCVNLTGIQITTDSKGGRELSEYFDQYLLPDTNAVDHNGIPWIITISGTPRATPIVLSRDQEYLDKLEEVYKAIRDLSLEEDNQFRVVITCGKLKYRCFPDIYIIFEPNSQYTFQEISDALAKLECHSDNIVFKDSVSDEKQAKEAIFWYGDTKIDITVKLKGE